MAFEKTLRKEDWIVIDNQYNGFDKSQFIIPTHYHNDVDRVLIPHGMILDRLDKLARAISTDTLGPLTACCVLKGAHQFYSDLMARMKGMISPDGENYPLQFDFIRVKSYVNDQSTGNVQISYTAKELNDLKGKHLKHILIVEDIIDTGKTMVALLDKLKSHGPASIRVVSLFLKRTERSNGYIPDYVGFEIPDKFIVGYSLDYDESFRDLDHVCTISEHGKVTRAVKN